MTYTFDDLRAAVQDCTSYDLVQRFSDDEEVSDSLRSPLEYVLIDPYGDQDGNPFYDLEDVVDFITNNSQVDEYLNNYAKEAA